MKFLTSCMLALLVLASFNLYAQDSKLKKANDLYDAYSFPEAAEAYKKALAKTDSPEAKIKLAECYRLMNMPVEAEYWYEQVIELAEAEPIHTYHYGMSLKANGKFEEAKQAFLEYAQMVPADSRGLRQVEACEQANYFLTDPGIYNITIADAINGGDADFGPAWYKEGIVYASENNVQNNDKEYNWRDRDFLDLMYAECEDEENPAQLSKPETFKGKVNTWVHEGTVTFSQDFTSMIFTRNEYFKGKIGYDKTGGDVGYEVKEEMKTVNLMLYEAKANGEKWGDVKPLPFNDSEYNVGHPTLSTDGQALYFISDMPGGYGMTDVYVSYKSGDSWGQPENLGPEINTEGREMFPYVAEDGSLYFASDAQPGLGGLDIFHTQLMDDGSWSQPENLRYPVNTNADDFAFIIDAENEKGYFSSNRPGGKGDDDIYTFTKLNNVLTGIVVDCKTEEPIDGALVKLMQYGEIMQKRKTNKNGMFTFPVDSDMDFEIVANKLGYKEGSQDLSTDGVGKIEVKIPICPEDPTAENGIFCEVGGRVYNKNTGEGVAGAMVTLTNVTTGEDKQFTTGNDGRYSFQLEPDSDFTLHATKELFFTETQTLTTKGRDCTDPQTKNLAMDITMEPLPTPPNVTDGGGGTIGGGGGTGGISTGPVIFTDPIIFDDRGNTGGYSSVPQLNHIYYDFDEHYIRDDAKPELDKVVAFMHANPSLIVELRSHTDSRGNNSYNQALSDRRANAARDYIISRGIPSDRLRAVGLGETQLTNECSDGVPCSNAKHQDNRRTEFAIIGYYNSGPKYSSPKFFYDNDYNIGKNYYKNGVGSYSGGGIGDTGYAPSGGYGISGGTTSGGSYSSSSGGGSYGISSGTTSGGSSYSTGGYYNTNEGSSTSSGTYLDTYNGSGYGISSTTTTAGGSSSGSNFGSSGAIDCCVTYDRGAGGSSSSYSSGASGTQFKVQLAATNSPDMGKYSALSDIGSVNTEMGSDGMMRVTLGTFFDRSSANSALTRIQERGFGDAYVVTYKNGLRMGR